MKKLFFLTVLLLTAQASASNFDVIYRFESSSSANDDYFTIKVDYDYIAPDGTFGNVQQVFDYEQFVEVFNDFVSGDTVFPPFYFFEVALVDSNMPFQFVDPSFGYTSVVASDPPLLSNMGINGFGFLFTNLQPVDLLSFPTGWELGQFINLDLYDDQFSSDRSFVLTEITPIPLPSALPLFGLSVLVLTRRSRLSN